MQELYKNILIATDGSENNVAAIKEGLRVAQACGAAVSAVYVIDDSVLGTEDTDAYEELSAEGKKAVARVKEMAGGVEVQTFVIEGKPSNAIADFAAGHGIDLVVVGTKSKGTIESLLLGSVASSVIKAVACPVLAVKNH